MSYDEYYDGMKKGGRVVKKKGKNVAIANQVVNVYTGRRGKRQPTAPRPQIIYQAPQIASQVRHNPYPLNDWREPVQNIRMRENYVDEPIRMVQSDSRLNAFGFQQNTEPDIPRQLPVLQQQEQVHPYDVANVYQLPEEEFKFENIYRPNMGEPVRVQSPPPSPPPVRRLPIFSFNPEPRPKDPFESLDMKKLLPFNAEPLDQKVMARPLEPMENKQMEDLIIGERDLNEPELIIRARPPRPPAEVEFEGDAKHEPIFIDELPRRKRRTKEEMDEARRQGEIRQVERRQEILQALTQRLAQERSQKPDSPFIKQLERDIEKLMKRR
jgi:hypothetical protein